MDIESMGKLYLELGAAGFIIVSFMFVFVWMLRKQMKHLIQNNLTLTKIYNVLYDNNANNLTLQSAFDIIEAQCNYSKYVIIEVMWRIYFENNIHDPIRQKLILENLNVATKNLLDRDIAVLSRFYYKEKRLSKYLETHVDPNEIVAIVFNNLLAKYKSSDIANLLHNKFDKIIQESYNYIEELTTEKKYE